MGIDATGFKKALSRWASGVTVVTSEHDGARHGLTVSAFSSLSLEPPLVLVCIGKSAPTHEAIRKSARFVVNVLAESQDAVSTRFASKHDDRFDGIPVKTGALGVPVIEGALATLECRLHDTLPGGDHSIFVGEVIHANVVDGSPLVYFSGGYKKIS